MSHKLNDSISLETIGKHQAVNDDIRPLGEDKGIYFSSGPTSSQIPPLPFDDKPSVKPSIKRITSNSPNDSSRNLVRTNSHSTSKKLPRMKSISRSISDPNRNLATHNSRDNDDKHTALTHIESLPTLKTFAFRKSNQIHPSPMTTNTSSPASSSTMQKQLSKSQMSMSKLSTTNNGSVVGHNNQQNNNQQNKTSITMFDKGTMLLIMTIATIFALYGDDFRVAALPESSDVYMFSLTIICLCLFVWEYVNFCIYKKDYMWSFFFYLDLIAILSLLPDIPWFWDPAMNSFADDYDTNSDLTVARAGRASRAGGRAGRIIRVIRIARLFRVVKLYKYFGNKITTDTNVEDESKESFTEDLSGSKIGAQLSEYTTRGVILGVLIMLFALPYLELSVIDEGDVFVLHQLYEYSTSLSAPTEYVNDMILSISTTLRHKPLYLYVAGVAEIPMISTISKYRDIEIEKIIIGDVSTTGVECWLDISHDVISNSIMGMCLTTWVMIVLGVGAYMFSKDAENAVIRPIQSMVKFVERVSRNPLAKIDVEEMLSNSEDENETSVLQNTLLKLVGLLQIGFGEAATEIIQNNLDGDTVDPMIPGQKICAVFGFCDIRDFDVVNLVLEEEIMGFVNTIAEILHGMCHRYEGAANKNTGNSFLMVWKFPKLDENNIEKDDSLIDMEYANRLMSPTENHHNKDNNNENKVDGSIFEEIDLLASSSPGRIEKISHTSNQALLAFLEVVIEIACSKRLQVWKNHKKILNVLPDFNLTMGFGLHAGWAIEGAIGSAQKIDASYLSPNVNMAARLEAATQIFGVPLLFSGVFYKLLDSRIQKLCRRIDRIIVKGSLQPMDIYTFDMSRQTFEDDSEFSSYENTFALHEIASKSPIQLRSSVLSRSRQTVLSDGNDISLKQSRSKTTTLRPLESSELRSINDNNTNDNKQETAKLTVDAELSVIGSDLSPPDTFAIKLDSVNPRVHNNENEEAHLQTDIIVETLQSLQQNLPEKFLETYEVGLNAYIAGNWTMARAKLEGIISIYTDNPTMVILGYMQEYDFVAPDDWKGHRELNRKR